MADEVPEDVQRWISKRRAALVLSLLKGETSVQEAGRKHGLTVAEIEDWKDRFLLAAENALRSLPRPKDEPSATDGSGRCCAFERSFKSIGKPSMAYFDGSNGSCTKGALPRGLGRKAGGTRLSRATSAGRWM